MNHIGLQRCDSVAPDQLDALRRAFAEAGVDSQTEPPSSRPGVVLGLLFTAHDRDLRDRLCDLACRPGARVIALHVGEDELPPAAHWSLLADGAADVIDGRQAESAAAAIGARLERWRRVDEVVGSALVRNHLVGDSAAWRQLLRQIVEVAAFTDSNALIVGESGTGKELVARLMHTLDGQRSQNRLVVLDCTTVMPDLAGSEFFGHERGAFTGATAPRDGAFALADGGTLFLDEVGELPITMQPQLLRVIQERSYKRVGGTAWSRANFRLVCATHRELESEVARSAFRSDLYWRIASCVLRLPPLRERREDILPLASRFLAEALGRSEAPPLKEAVRDYLMQRAFAGNVRELRQLMGRIASRHVGEGPVTVGAIPADERPRPAAVAPDWRGPQFDQVVRRALDLGAGLCDISAQAAEAAIRIAVGDEDGNLQRAARRLGVTDRALQLRRAAVSPQDSRS